MFNKNDIITITITDLTTEGEGIGKLNGFPLFVRGAVPGDVIEALVLKTKKTYGYAKILNIIKPSANRVTPFCTVSDKCGGCQIQQLAYEKQIELKEKKVIDSLTRLGGLDTEFVKSRFDKCYGMHEPRLFRNKASVPIRTDSNGNLKMGFYAYHSHRIIETENCEIEHPSFPYILRNLKKVISEFNISAYDEEKGKGLLRHCLIRTGFESGQIMVCLIMNADEKEVNALLKKSPFMTKLTEELQKGIEELNSSLKSHSGPVYSLASLCINLNTENTNVILGNKLIPFFGPLYMEDSLDGVRFRISPLSFYQVNPAQTVRIYNKVLEYASLTGKEIVWDLYCGIGTISLFLARKAGKVYGVEIVPEAIENAKENARLNGIENAEFFVGASENVAPELLRKLIAEKHIENNLENDDSRKVNPDLTNLVDVIVVDPPRSGCDSELLNTIVRTAPSKLVYVSCDPATLGRDVKFLSANGYTLEKVCAYDQFGHSMHVESVVLLSKSVVDKDNYSKS